MSRFEQLRDEERYASRAAEQIETFKRWLEKNHPEIPFNEATLRVFKDADEMGSAFLTATDDDFEFHLRTTRTDISRQHVPTPEEVKADLIEQTVRTKADLMEKILGLIASTNGGRDGKYDVHSLKTERSKMAGWSIQQLTARLEEIVRKQDLNSKPIAELHKIVQSAHRYTGYPQLGKTVVRPGTVRAVALDAAYLRGLDVWELKKMCRLYGSEQVNNRLAGRD